MSIICTAWLALLAASASQTSMTAEPPIERIKVEPGRTLNDFMASPLDYTQADVDPGIAPEGDYMGFSAFTRDGSRVLLTNRMTGNVTIFDWSTMAVLANVDVGYYPGGIAVTDSFAVITLGFSDSVLIMRLSDYSIAARLPSGEQPWVVRISPDQRYAYVACDISNTCEVYDLENLTHAATIPNFPIFLSTYSWNSENGRNSFTFSGFEVSPDGTQLLIPDGRDTLFFFDVASGQAVDTVTGIGSCRFIAFSGDSQKFVTANGANPGIVFQFDAATHEVTGAVTLTGYTLMTFEGAVNLDGSKAYLGVSNNRSALVRFATSDFITFSQTYTAFWIGVSPDHARAVSAQYNFSIIDFATEEMLGQHSGNSQSVGAVSPVDNRAVGYDPHRHEGVYFYDYTSPGPGMYRGTTNAGLDPEGDCPHRVAMSPDGRKAIATGVLSDNASVIDLATRIVDTILPIGDRPQEIGFTSDSRWAVIAGLNSNVVVVVDMNDLTTAAEVPVGSGVYTISVSSDDSFAYAGSISSNTVSKIRLDGASSWEVARIPVGEIGIIWGAYGVPSDVRVSPDGRHCLVAVSFTDEVQVIDTRTNFIVATLPTGDFPLQFAFNATGDYAVVTNALGNSITVMHIMGESSAVVGTFAYGQYPVRAAYNPVLDRFGIVNMTSKTLTEINPETGSLINTRYYTTYGNPIRVQYDADGLPLVVTALGTPPGYLLRDTQAIVLPATPCYFDFAANRAAVSMPGPDWVTIVDWTTSAADEHTLRLAGSGLRLDVPAVIAGPTTVRFSLPGAGPACLKLYDITGKLVRTLAQGRLPAGSSAFELQPSDLASGIYLLRLETTSTVTTSKLIVE